MDKLHNQGLLQALTAPDPGHWPRLHPRQPAHALLDGVIQVNAEASRELARHCAREERILVGISSCAAVPAIAQKLPELGAGARVLVFNYGTGEKCLSIEGFLPA